MREFISISKRPLLPAAVSTLGFCLALCLAIPASAASGPGAVEEDEFSSNPFTEYGEFNQDKDEEAEARFFQHGRFFGVSVGLGMETLDGNRGILWQGGFPTFELKLHYWFDFHAAMDLGFYTAPHHFKTTAEGLGATDANMTFVGVNLKYYFDTKDLSAPVSFASPYVILGAGSFTKTESSLLQGESQPDTSIGLSVGAGLEFPIKHRSMYFALEGKAHLLNFKDTYTDTHLGKIPNLENLSGRFYTVIGSLLFTW